MTETELITKLKKFGYTRLWMDFGLLTEEQLLEQEALFNTGADQNTEHYRYSVCKLYVQNKKTLSTIELERFFSLLRNDPDTYMAGSAAIDLFTGIELTDEQFDWLAGKISLWGDWTGKTVLRQTLLRKLKKEEHTEELMSTCILTGDSVVQRHLLDRCRLNQSQLQELAIHGRNKEIRNMAEKRL